MSSEFFRVLAIPRRTTPARTAGAAGRYKGGLGLRSPQPFPGLRSQFLQRAADLKREVGATRFRPRAERDGIATFQGFCSWTRGRRPGVQQMAHEKISNSRRSIERDLRYQARSRLSAGAKKGHGCHSEHG